MTNTETATSEVPTQTTRHEELDIARGLAVLLMVAVHVLQVLARPSVQSSGAGLTIEFLGSVPAAPVFMAVLGAGLVFSRRSEPGRLLRRGLAIMGLGYLLNLLRGGLPSLLGSVVLEDPAYVDWAILEFLSVDILQFAGLAMIFFAFVKKARIGVAGLVVLGLVFGAVAYVLDPLDVESVWLGGVTGLFWGSHEVSFFAFVNWIPYPIAGYCFGLALKRSGDKRRFYRRSLLASVLLTVMLFIVLEPLLGLDIGYADVYSYPHHHLHVAALYLSFVLMWISLIAVVFERIPMGVRRAIGSWSRNVTPIYVIHWVIIGWTAIGLEGALGYVGYAVAVLAIGGVSALLATVWMNRRGR